MSDDVKQMSTSGANNGTVYILHGIHWHSSAFDVIWLPATSNIMYVLNY